MPGGCRASAVVTRRRPVRLQDMTQKATFAAGCFWGVEAAFRQIPGVVSTRVGYTGGHTENPTYREVCGKRTGHAEAVEVTLDPSAVSYDELLAAFWREHNPRSRHRPGPDGGPPDPPAVH